MNIKPINGQLIVEVDDFTDSYYGLKDGKTESGIIVTKTDIQGIPNQGVIVAVADAEKQFKVGMKVVFSTKSPRGYKYDDKSLFTIGCDDVTAIIEEA